MTDHRTYGDIIRDFQGSAPVDITALANALGLNVLESYDLPAGISGKIAIDRVDGGVSGYAITLNAQENYRRRRFTVAHECAHYILHRNQIGDELTDDALYRSDKLPSTAEFEANNLAADLLMPRTLISSKQQEGYTGLAALADLFEVSQRAMEVRLRYLSWTK